MGAYTKQTISPGLGTGVAAAIDNNFTGITNAINGLYYTPEGGLAVKLINKTGAASIKGTLVEIGSSVTKGFVVSSSSTYKMEGVVYENGVADGGECYVVISGIAQCLAATYSASTVGKYAYSSVAGRVEFTDYDEQLELNKVGVALESKTTGANVLVLVLLNI